MVSLISPEVVLVLELLGFIEIAHFLAMLNHLPLVDLLNFAQRNQFEFVIIPDKLLLDLLGTNGLLEGDLFFILGLLFLEFLDLGLEEKIGLLEILDVLVLHFVNPDGFLELVLGLFLLDARILLSHA
jgi:hypothetical protein